MTPPSTVLARFTTGEKWVHRATAALMGVCLLTAAVLYFGPLSVLVGRRALVEQVHVIAGIALPVPILAGWLSRAFRADVSRLNRFSTTDWAWLRSRGWRGSTLPVGKFNAGQKLNASFILGAIAVLLGTGLIMRFANTWPLSLRTGATFVHDWLSYAVTGVLLGHVMFALRDPAARTGLRTGAVPASWAYQKHRGWAEEAGERKGS
ncbi:MAG: cytochrome b/b6 domain-containing protein [Pseudonocardiales bacterium]